MHYLRIFSEPKILKSTGCHKINIYYGDRIFGGSKYVLQSKNYSGYMVKVGQIYHLEWVCMVVKAQTTTEDWIKIPIDHQYRW